MANFNKSLHLYEGDVIVWGQTGNGHQWASVKDRDGHEALVVFFDTVANMVQLRDALSARIAELEAATPEAALNEFGETTDEAQARIDEDMHDHCEAE